MATEIVRTFDTGANRDTDDGKYDFEGFISPQVLERFGEYMHKHRQLADGSVRDSDNWQKGIPLTVYIKSLVRHAIDLWRLHRGGIVLDKKLGTIVSLEELCCAILFNTQGYLHEILKVPVGHRLSAGSPDVPPKILTFPKHEW